MGQRTVGAAMLAAGLGGAAVVLLADVGLTALVAVSAVGATGLLVLRQRDGPPPAGFEDGPDGPPFATAIDDGGHRVGVARGEVDAVFGTILDRWRGVLALRLDDDGDGPSAQLEGAMVELRGDILRAEAYLDALRFRDPLDRRDYDEQIADLEALLRRAGDAGWGRRTDG